jgi:hypothetical protein
MKALRWLALFLGASLACQAWAYENLLGEYTGKLGNVEGYSFHAGDPCTAMVGTSDLYGGSLIFEIHNVEKILMETRNVEEALKRKSDTVRVFTPGSSASQPSEVVLMKLGRDGIMRGLVLKRIWKQQHQEESVTCGDLRKK